VQTETYTGSMTIFYLVKKWAGWWWSVKYKKADPRNGVGWL